VTNVVAPPRSSVRTVVPFSLSLKNRATGESATLRM
jgi:hypothetical protein